MYLFADSLPGIVIALLIVGIFGVIVIGVILLKKYTKVFKSDEKPKSEKEIAAEELDRLLQPIEEEVVEKTEEEEAPAEAEEKPAEEAPEESPKQPEEPSDK